jgi:hypothetical protein
MISDKRLPGWKMGRKEADVSLKNTGGYRQKSNQRILPMYFRDPLLTFRKKLRKQQGAQKIGLGDWMK